MAKQFDSVEAYIGSFPTDTQKILEDVRQTIHSAVPEAGETISYQIPTITSEGASLLYFAGWKRHLSLYPAPEGDAEFERAVAPYRSGQSTLKFSLSEPIPHEVIEQVAALHLEQRRRGNSES